MTFCLVFFYPRWTVDPAQWWQYLPAVGLIAAVVAGVVAGCRGRRVPLAAFLLFCGTLVPVLGFFNLYPFLFSYVFNHFQYLASLYVVAPLASCVALLVNRVPAAARRPAWAGVTALLMVLDAFSWNQSGRPRPRRTPWSGSPRPPGCRVHRASAWIPLR